MSADEPTPEDASPQAPPPVPAPTPQAPPLVEPAPAAVESTRVASARAQPPSQRVLLIAGAVVVVIGLIAFLVLQSGGAFNAAPGAISYSVQPYTPPSHVVSAHDHVLAYSQPQDTSPSVVMFGQGVGLNVTGRVSRGLGDDWYAITWNGQTAFIRQRDVQQGEAAPPTAEAHKPPPERPDVDDTTTDEEDNADSDAPPPDRSGPFELTNYDWIRRPSARDFQRFYPRHALNEGQSGRVALDCTADPSGRLNCSIAEESPTGYGFGDAALSIAQQLRLQPTLGDGRSVAGGHLRLPLSFRTD